MSSLAHHLLGQTRSAVLSALLLHPEKSLHVRELARLTGASPGSLHRDLRALAGLGLLLRQEVGRQVHYRANPDHPVFSDLAGLLRLHVKTVERMARAGRLPSLRVFGRVRFRPSDVASWLADREDRTCHGS